MIATSPPDDGIAALPLGCITVTFDQPMYAGDSQHPASVTNLSNYEIVGAATGNIAIESVVYDADSQTAILFPRRFEPDQYELHVLATLASAEGLGLADTYTATFLAVSDFSALLEIEFSQTRSSRAEATVSYDVRITNTSEYDLQLPLLLILDPALGYEGIPRNAAGLTPDGAWIVDLSQALPPNGRLAPGESTTGRTVVIDNDGNWHVDYDHGAYALPTINVAPVFDSDPVEDTEVGEQYVYHAEAHDPDGTVVIYMLYEGPHGMTVDPLTGLVEWSPTATASARTSVVVHAYDSRGGRGTQQFVIDVAGGNHEPLLAPLPAVVEVNEGELLEIVLSADDPDGDVLLAGANNLPPGARFDATQRVLSWIPGNNAAGTYSDIQFSVTDGIHEALANLTILVLPTDQGPYLVKPQPRTIREGERLQLYLDGGDPDGEAVRYYSNLLPPGARLNPNTGSFEWTPDYYQAGEYTFPLSVVSGGKTTTVEAAITVLNVNGPPTFLPLDTWQGYEGEPIRFRPLAVDPDNPGSLPPIRGQGNQLVVIGSGPSSLTYTADGLPSGAQFDAETATFTWEPGYDAAGDYIVSFTATDDGDGVGPVLACALTTRIIVHNYNRSPEIVPLSNVTVQQGETRLLTVEALDPDGNPLTLTATNALTGYRLPDFISFADHGGGMGSFTLTPEAGYRGDYTVSLMATDDGDAGQSSVATDEISFVVTVETENDPPVLDYIGDKVAVVGIPFELVMRASDLDEEQFNWAMSGLPAAATLTPSGSSQTAVLKWLPTFADVGSHTVVFEVSDGGNGDPAFVAADNQTIALTVRATNQAPVLAEPGDLVVQEGETLVLPFSATDANGDVLTYSAENLPPGASLNPQSGVLTWNPQYGQAGDYSGIVVRAGDGQLSDTVTFGVEVTDTNRAPILIPMFRQLGREGSLLQLSVLGSDLDGDPIWYRAAGLPVGATLNRQTGRFSWTPGFTDAGQYIITFEAVDTRGAVGTADVVVEIENENRAPSIVVTDHAVALGQVLQFSLIAHDPDPGTTLTYSAEGLPAGASVDPLTGQFTWAPQIGQAQEHVVAFLVSDGEEVASRSVVILAAAAPSPVDVHIEVTPSFAAAPGASALVHVIADSLANIAQISLRVDGEPVALDAQGRATLTAQQPGKRHIEATAVDADGFVGRATAVMRVLDPTDQEAPVVALSNALSREALSELVEVEGTVADRNLDFWRLEIAWYGSDDFHEIASGESSVGAGVLGTLDPAALRNGFYQLRLTARDIAKRTSVAKCVVEVNSSTKSAAYPRLETDLAVQIGGTSVTLSRAYNSLANQTGAELGYGWRLVPRDTDIQTNAPLTGREHLGVYGALRDDSRLYVTLPSGERVGFSFVPVAVNVAGLTFYRPAWQADPGVSYTLDSVPAMLMKAGRRFHDLETGQPYNPQSPFYDGPDYALRTPDGTPFEIDSARGIVAQVTPSGDRLLYSDSGIVTATGAAIQFVYDSQGRISRAISSEGKAVVYLYDELGNLASVRNLATGQHTTYGYDAAAPHLLTGAVYSDGTGEAVLYDGTSQTVAIAGHLGGVDHFTSQSATGDLTSGATQRYTFTMRSSEIKSVSSGDVLIQVWIDSAGSNLAPGAPSIAGLEPWMTQVTADQSMGVFAVNRAGLYQVLVAGSDNTTTGGYEVRLRVAGDINADSRVDGVDSALLAAAQGTAVGEPGYLAEADLDASGTIDGQDTLILIANYGFVANRPPEVNPVAPDLLTHQDLAIAISLEGIVLDPDGDAVFYQVTNVEHGTVALSVDGQMALLVPDPGFVGTAYVRLMADDGSNASEEISLEITVSDAPLLGVEIVNRTPQFDVGGVTQLTVVGDFADQQDAPLLGRYVAFASTDPSVAQVSSSGLVQANSRGSAVLIVSRGPWQAATVARVGVPIDAKELYLTKVGLNVYPESLTLPPGETRQMIVRLGVGDSISAAVSGTRYVVGNTGVLSVDDNGLVTAMAEGATTLTIFNGPAEMTIPINVVASQVGPVEVGEGGGVVQGADGSLLAISPGSLDTPVDASITPLSGRRPRAAAASRLRVRGCF